MSLSSLAPIVLCILLATSIGSSSINYGQSNDETKPKLTILTDKTLYFTGEQVVLKFNVKPVDVNKEIEVSIFYSESVALTPSVRPNEDGSALYSFQLLKGAPAGKWQVNATYLNATASTAFSVYSSTDNEANPAALPTIIDGAMVNLTSEKPSYAIGDTIEIAAQARPSSKEVVNLKEPINITLIGSDGNRYLSKNVVPENDAPVGVKFEITKYHPLGNWTALGSYMDAKNNISFSVYENKTANVTSSASLNNVSLPSPKVALDKDKYKAGDTIYVKGTASPLENLTIQVIDPRKNVYLEGMLGAIESNHTISFPIRLAEGVNAGNWSVQVTNGNSTQKLEFVVVGTESSTTSAMDLEKLLLPQGRAIITNLKNTTKILFNNTGNANVSSILIKLDQGTIQAVEAKDWEVKRVSDDAIVLTSTKALEPSQLVNVTLKVKDLPELPTTMSTSVTYKGAEVGPILIVASNNPTSTGDVPSTPDPLRHILRIKFEGTGTGAVSFLGTDRDGICTRDACDITFHPDMVCTNQICSIPFHPNIIYFAAHPDGGSFFAGWGGDCSGTGDFYSNFIDRDWTCTATFIREPIIQVRVIGSGIGAVFSTRVEATDEIRCGSGATGVCSFGFFPGTTITLRAIAASGSIFLGWGDDCLGGQQDVEILLDRDKICTAIFGPEGGVTPPSESLPPVIPEFVRMSRILADRQSVDLGWPITVDRQSPILPHFQLFRTGNSPFLNSAELYTSNEGKTCVSMAITPPRSPYWYDEYGAVDTDIGKSYSIRMWANEFRTFGQFRDIINLDPNLWPNSYSPYFAPYPPYDSYYPPTFLPNRGPPPQWFVQCSQPGDGSEVITDDVPNRTDPSITNAAFLCDYIRPSAGLWSSSNGYQGTGPPSWAMVRPIYRGGFPIGWTPDAASGIIMNSFLSGHDATPIHANWPEGYWLGVSPPYYYSGPDTEGNCDWTNSWWDAAGQLCNDWNGHLWPDPQYSKLLNPSYLLGRGNLVLELEQWLVPNGYRPEPGDRAYVVGRLISDCGELKEQLTPRQTHTELHPLELILSSYLQYGPPHVVAETETTGCTSIYPCTKNLPLIALDWQRLTSGNPATVNKLVVTSYWQGKTLKFDIWPPPRPSDTAMLRWAPEPGIREGEGVKITWEAQPRGNPNHLHVEVFLEPPRPGDKMEFGFTVNPFHVYRSAGSPCSIETTLCTLHGSVTPKIERRVVNAFLLWWELNPVSIRPTVTIQGPTQAQVDAYRAGTVTLNYNMLTQGMHNPQIITWTAQGVVSTPTSESTSITFTYDGIEPGASEVRRVAVYITDDYGYTAKHEILVELFTPDPHPCPTGMIWDPERERCVPRPTHLNCPAGSVPDIVNNRCIRIHLR